MKPTLKIAKVFFIVCLIALTSCIEMSEQIRDGSIGLNGSFEISKNGMPVNWALYSPNTVPKADFNITLDTENYIEGKQSLRFDVKKCSAIGGRLSPGFTNEFFAVGKFEGKARYKLSFWIKNTNSRFTISAGSVTSKTGEIKTLMEKIKSIQF